ncbi:MAG: hypothetical protein AUG02_05780 [Chloroflexi bacterium 13_1_20CM_2_70_9]|nr:MAG: hypothetical protein AUG02_05780 [Chloroflexi bacterium 13_1_20CM_2_70_9]
MTSRVDVVVVGAGPYGLAAAARLRQAGADVCVFGPAMSFWNERMPRGMFLRSPWAASHIGDLSPFTLDDFQRERGSAIARPIPLAEFVAYGHWFEDRAVRGIDRRRVDRVEPFDGGFRLRLEDGQPVTCARVVVATGISDFAWQPREFDGLPRELASHSSEHSDLGCFAGRDVVVIGGGQSALESAALLREAGADVEVIMRTAQIHWVGRASRRGLLGRILFDRTDVGPALLSHVVARPRLVRRLPTPAQRYATRRSLVAGGALWLRPRLEDVRMTTGRKVVGSVRSNGHLELKLDDGTTREVDHALLATGYRVDVRRYRFLAESVVESLRCEDGHPVLDEGLQSSIRGLYFLGAPAVWSFGPLLRFVAGTGFAAGALVRGITRGVGRAFAAAPAPAFDAPSTESGTP